MPLQMKLTAITLDCSDPLGLAAFYQQATGLEPHPRSDADFAALTREDGFFIGFQRVDDYRAPRWPDQSVPQQFHLDFAVEDLDEAETRLLELGAGKPVHQPGRDRWRVFTDPAGHPFCVVRGKEGEPAQGHAGPCPAFGLRPRCPNAQTGAALVALTEVRRSARAPFAGGAKGPLTPCRPTGRVGPPPRSPRGSHPDATLGSRYRHRRHQAPHVRADPRGR